MNNNFKDESQKYLDEMMRLYSLGKSESVSTTAEPIGSVPKPPISQQSPSSDILDEEANEPSAADRRPEPVPRPYPVPPENDNRPEFPDMSPRPQSPPMQGSPEPVPRPYPVSPENDNRPEFPDVPPRPQAPPMQERPEERPQTEQNRPQPQRPPMQQRPQPPLRPVIPPVLRPQPQPPQNEYGYMKIEVRTGENGIPVPDASVTVARKVGDSEELVFSGTTNSSGAVEKLRLPAPTNLKNSDPGSFGNYAAYNVNVYYKGFYRESAQNVPVFSGVTTIQRFNLVPLPFNFKDDGQEIVVTSEQPEI